MCVVDVVFLFACLGCKQPTAASAYGTQGGNDGNIPSLAGVGVVFRAAKNGGGDLRVVAVAPDGPAKESGLNPKP